jgi:hypothetical protein
MRTQKIKKHITWFWIATVICCFALSGCNDTARNKSEARKDISFTVVCVDKYVYLNVHGYYQGYLVIKLDDNGNPVKCNK